MSPTPKARRIQADVESLSGDSTFGELSWDEKIEVITSQIESLAGHHDADTTSKQFTSSISSALSSIDLEKALKTEKGYFKGNELGMHNAIGRKIIVVVQDQVFPATNIIGTGLFRRVVESDYPLTESIEQVDQLQMQCRLSLLANDEQRAPLLTQTSVVPNREFIFSVHRQGALDRVDTQREYGITEFHSYCLKNGLAPTNVEYQQASVTLQESLEVLKVDALATAEQAAEREFMETKSAFDSATRELTQLDQAQKSLRTRSSTIATQLVILNGIHTVLSRIVNLVKSAVNSIAPGMISTLNMAYRIRDATRPGSGRSGDNAFETGDLTALLHVLRENYQEATLALLSRSLTELFSVTAPTPLKLNSAITEIFQLIKFTKSWRLMTPEFLHAILLIRGVHTLNPDLARELNSIQYSYCKLVQTAESVSGDIVAAMATVDEIKGSLVMQLQECITNYNQSQTYMTSPATESSKRSSTNKNIGDAQAYSAGDASESVYGDSDDYTDRAMSSQQVNPKGRGGTQGRGGGQGRDAGGGRGHSNNRQFFFIRKGTYFLSKKEGGGKVVCDVFATRDKADLPNRVWRNPKDEPPLLLKYVVTGQNNQPTGTVEVKQYTAQEPKPDGTDSAFACKICGFTGHKAAGCLQLPGGSA